MNSFILFILGPSGTGKTTFRKWIIDKYSDFRYPVSLTTRKKRVGEVDGVDYRFISKLKFQNLINENQLIEWEEHFGNYYGIEECFFTNTLEANKSIVKEIAFDGYAQFLKNTSIESTKICSIFLYPSNIDFLKKRLENRGDKDTNVRMLSIQEELKYFNECDKILYIDESNSDSIKKEFDKLITDLQNK